MTQSPVPMPEDQPLLPLWEDGARHLQLGRTVAYRLAQRGELPIPPLRIGGRWFVRTADLRRYLGLSEGLHQ